MADSSSPTSEVENGVTVIKKCIDLAEKVINEAEAAIDEKSTVTSADNFISEMDEFLRVSSNFIIIYENISASKNSFTPDGLQKYYESLSTRFGRNHRLLNRLQSIMSGNALIFSVDDISELRSLFTNLRRFFDGLESDYKFLESHRIYPEISSSIIAQWSPDVPKSLNIEISDINNNAESIISAFRQYIAIAKYTDANESVFENIVSGISKIIKEFYDYKIDPNCPKLLSFASIVGPSFMGKTQFAFSLARLSPVFYVNFAPLENLQEIYRAFEVISIAFDKFLRLDVDKLKGEKIAIDSGVLKQQGLKIKLATVGLLWNLVKYSMEFEFDGSAEWFEYYLAARRIEFQEMSVHEYLVNLKDLIEEMKSKKKKFVAPRVFIDEYITTSSDLIKLLRNLSKIMGLAGILASTNAKVNNSLNVSDSASAPSKNTIWVHAIRILPKANIRGIVHFLGWDEFINNRNLTFKVKELLESFIISYVSEDFRKFENLIKLMKQQCETCLQGVGIIVFQSLKDELDIQRGNHLNIKAIWKHILIDLRSNLISRKFLAFEGIGRYHTLAMMTNHQMMREGAPSIVGLPRLTSEIILETIHHHYYFFGRTSDPVVLPLKYRERKLIFNDDNYKMCSYFKLFFENIFFCLAMWIRDNGVSVASIVADYTSELRGVNTNIRALKNNFSAQECAVHWALCNSTLLNSCSSELNPGFPLLQHLIFNIQIDNDILDTITSFSNISINPSTDVKVLTGVIDFRSSSELVSFLDKIKIPQLLPDELVTREIRDNLNGFCQFGACNRLPDREGIDIEFDLFFNGAAKKGFIECKYNDTNLGKSKVLEYVVKTSKRNSPFSMLVTSSMQHCLKSAALWNSGEELLDSEDEESTSSVTVTDHLSLSSKKPKLSELSEKEALEMKEKRIATIKAAEKIIEGTSIYSIFYNETGMIAVPLFEHPNPTSVFVIIETNFI